MFSCLSFAQSIRTAEMHLAEQVRLQLCFVFHGRHGREEDGRSQMMLLSRLSRALARVHLGEGGGSEESSRACTELRATLCP